MKKHSHGAEKQVAILKSEYCRLKKLYRSKKISSSQKDQIEQLFYKIGDLLKILSTSYDDPESKKIRIAINSERINKLERKIVEKMLKVEMNLSALSRHLDHQENYKDRNYN